MMDFLLLAYFAALAVSLLFLWLSGDLSVKYSIETAAKFKLTSLFVGFVLIAVSTGLPELSVVISSLMQQAPAISAGTILGSNVCDISLVLGLAILLGGSIQIEPKEGKDSLMMLLVTTLAMVLVFLLGVLTRIFGLLLILIYVVAIWWLWKSSTKKEISEEEKEQKEIVADADPFFKKKWGILLKLFLSVVAVLISSEFAVRFAIELTKMLKLSLETVGATIFAVGTSLPEISLGLNAVKKREYSLVLGNSLGSVLEQGTLLLGLLAFASPKSIDIRPLRTLAPFMLISFAIIFWGILIRKKLTRIEGLLMFTLFVVFMIYQIAWVR
jgi:cation:H+ antiporter